MAESFTRVAPDSTGNRMRTRARTIASQLVHEQYIALASMDTWIAYANAVAFANAKRHLSIYNAAASGVIVRARKLFAVNLQTATVTGIWQRMDFHKFSSAHSGGTLITPEAMDSNNAALPAGVTVRTGASVTLGNLVFPWTTSTEEETAGIALSKAMFQQSVNALIDGPEIQEWTMREGEGLVVNQNVNSTVGSFGYILAFSVEPAT